MNSVLAAATLGALLVGAAAFVGTATHRLLLVTLAVVTAVQTPFLGLIAVPLAGTGAAVVVPLIKVALLCALLARAARPNQLRRSGRFSLLGLAGTSLILIALVYTLVPTAGLLGTPTTSTIAKSASLLTFVVPMLLVVTGLELSKTGLSPRYLERFILIYGAALACIALIALIFVAPETWVPILSRSTQVGTNTLPSTTIYDGLHSFFFGSAIPRAVAPFGSPLALAFSLCLPACILLYRHQRTAGEQMMLVVICIALALTETRIVILGIIVMSMLTRPHGAKSLIGRRLTLLSLGLIALATGPVATGISNTISGADPSSRNHASAIMFGLRTLANHPFGVGIGQGGRIGRQFGQSLAGGENLFLVIGNQFGWLGLILSVVVAAALARRLWQWRNLRLSATSIIDRDMGILGGGFLMCALVLIVASLTTEHAIAFQSTWLFWLGIGWLIGQDTLGTRLDEQVPLAQVPTRRGPQ